MPLMTVSAITKIRNSSKNSRKKTVN